MCIEWIHSIFNECAQTDREAAAILIGYLSILFWLFAQLPQVYENYKVGNTNSLSPSFLTIWLIGDLTNFIGCLLTNQLPFQIYLSAYFVILDTILCLQYIYYSVYLKKGRVFDEEISDRALLSMEDEVEVETVWFFDKTEKSGKEIKSYGTLYMNYGIILLMLPFLYHFHSTEEHAINWQLKQNDLYFNFESSEGAKSIFVFGEVCAWISCFCYLSSRLPQLYKNFVRKSVKGLSMYLFLFAAFGNTFYTLSIVLKSTHWQFLMQKLPFLLGSFGTLIFDFCIFIQWVYYTRSTTFYQALSNC